MIFLLGVLLVAIAFIFREGSLPMFLIVQCSQDKHVSPIKVLAFTFFGEFRFALASSQ